jgi:thiol-disulfide isomerase/thioredoxin
MKLLTLLALFLAGCPGKLDVETSEESAVEIEDRSWVTWDECGQMPGENPCNFTLMDQNNNEVELYDFHGKVIILDLSAMWCGICVNIAGQSELLVEDLGPDKVVWITVLVEDESGLPPDQSDLLRWESLHNASGPILAGDRSIVDPTAKDGYPVTGWPTIVIIDQEMTVHNGVSGWSEELVRSWVSSLL